MQEFTSNTDTDELRKFALLSDDWWNPGGDLKTLHTINPLRLHYIDRAAPLVNKQVLDLGCGGGLLSEAMAGRGARVTGLDANTSVIEIARHHASLSHLRIDYIAMTAEQYAQNTDTRYDLITCMELLEHVPDPTSLFHACAQLLKPGGDLIIATLNRNARSYASAILAAEYLLGLLPRGTHDYAKFLKPSEVARDLRRLNFDIVDISGMHYMPVLNRCFINNDPAVNYLLHARARLP